MNNLKFLFIASVCLLLMASITPNPPKLKEKPLRDMNPITPEDPPCLQMYHCIEYYADSFNIPKRYAYGVAKVETGYKGPFHWRYNPAQTSCANALGPMQILLSTARGLNKDHVSREQLKTDIKYNVRTSMKMLRRLYKKYKNWGIVFGYYNTGYPQINGYAIKVLNHKIDWK
jgi:soluble lytic murein transglycosylase-like protein